MNDEQQILRHALLNFARAIRDPHSEPAPDGVSVERLHVYHALFLNNIRGSLEHAFPVARSLLDDTLWEDLVVAFFSRHRCRVPEFPRMPEEFLRWYGDRKQKHDAEPPFLPALLYWEWLELDVMLDASTLPANMLEADEIRWLRDCPVPAAGLRIEAFDFPVHRISAAHQPQRPLEQPVFLAVFRDADDRTCFNELTPAAAALLSLVRERPGLPGGHYVASLARMGSHSNTEALTAFADDFLARCREDGLLAGAVPAL